MKKFQRIALSALLFGGASVLAGGNEPAFSADGKIIELSSQWGLCGGLTLKPNEGYQDVQVTAMRTDITFFTKVENAEKVGTDTLNVGGSRYKYDWGGAGTSYKYKIYCRAIVKDTQSKQVPCKEAVTIEDVRQNVPCVGVAGPAAEYGKLNMYRNAPVID